MDRHLHEDLHQQMKMNKEMFDGNKEYPTQWALNPSTYQGMSNDQVDWAALAQQWIKMKEVVVPPAPPPPCLSNNTSNNSYDNDERGEAPMDMDTKDDDIPPAPPAPNISGNENNWNQWSQWGQWNSTAPGGACWEWSGVPPPGVQIGPDGRPMGNPSIMSTTVPPAPNISGRSSFNIPPPGSTTTTTTTSTTIPYNYNTQVDFNSGYWSGEQSHQMTSGHPPPFLKGIRHNNRPLHMRNDIIRRDDKEKTPDVDSSVVIDAAKRRQLPAWIREGLEKMERQKHKAVERERQEILRSQELEARKIAEEEARAVLNPSKSKFDSDSDKELEQDLDDRDNDDKKNNTGISPEIIVRPRRSRFRDAESPESRVTNNDSPTFLQPIVNSPVKRSRDEILQDVMLKVRRSLTEILLEVTNEEISNVCREVWSRARTKEIVKPKGVTEQKSSLNRVYCKAPAGDTPVASLTNRAPIAQITRELGLGIYGDSNSDSEEEQEIQPADNNDSDFELKETLRRRQAAFKKTEEEIEARLAEDEENELRSNEEQTSKYDNHTSNDKIIKSSVDEKTINNEREKTSETSDVQTQRRQLNSDKLIRTHTPSRSIDTTTTTTTTTTTSQSSTSSSSSSSSSTSSTESDNTDSSYNRNKKNRKRNKERSISRSRNKRSNKIYRSRSSSKKNNKKLINEKKRRSRSKSNSRSKSRKRSRSRSKRQSRERKRSRSRSRDRERRRSRSYGYSRRRSSRSRTRSRERRRSRSRSRGYRDGKKSSRRYKD